MRVGLLRRLVGAGQDQVTRRLYLDLLKKAVMNELGLENELRIDYLRACIADHRPPDDLVMRDIRTRQPEAFSECLNARLDGNLFRNRVAEFRTP